MSKVVRFLQNEDDFKVFCDYIYSNKYKIYSYEAKPFNLEEVKKINYFESFRILGNESDVQIEKIGKRNIFSEASDYLEFDNCDEKNGVVDHGCIIYRHGELALHIFNNIKRYIVANYILSDDKTCYVGRGFYKQWWERKISTNWLIQRDEIKVYFSNDERHKLLENLLSQGLQLISFSDYRKEVDLEAEIIAICLPNDNIKIDIRVRRNYVSPDAKCIFMYKNKKYNSLLLDKRIIVNNEKIVYIFKRIQQYLKDRSFKMEYWKS